jgi:hypothetical protein
MSFARRILSLLAAYSVALQLLLLPLQVAAGANLPGAHCAPDGRTQNQSDGMPCCMAGCGPLCQHHVLAPPPVAMAEPRRAWTARRMGIALEQLAGPITQVSTWARGPPRSERA